MFERWTFSKRLAAGFGLAGLMLLLVAGIAYLSTQSLIENEDWVLHTHAVRIDLADLTFALVNAETGERGYIITGDENYLEPYTASLAPVERSFEDVRKLTADNPVQQQRWIVLGPLIDAILADFKQKIDLRRTQGFAAVEKVVAENKAKALLDKIRGIMAEADSEEAALLDRRHKDAVASARWAMAFMLWGGLVGLAMVALIGWFVIRSLSRQIGKAVGLVQSSSAELQAAANQQASGAREQATAMNEIATTIRELLTTSRQIGESAQQVASIADQTAAAARLGHGTVDLTHESIAGIRRQVDQIVTHTLDMGKKSQEIGSVLDIVAELAEQTNILAINATIEAVGAGEAGKRFAVVADEIRKLADRVGGSTKEIRSLIDEVRSAVNTTVMATETGSKAVDSGTRQFGDVAAAFKQIAGLVVTTTDAAREIELSTKQQTTAVEQVDVAVANAAQASKETETSSGQTFTTASQLAVLSNELTRIIRQQSNGTAAHGG